MSIHWCAKQIYTKIIKAVFLREAYEKDHHFICLLQIYLQCMRRCNSGGDGIVALTVMTSVSQPVVHDLTSAVCEFFLLLQYICIHTYIT